MSVVKGLRSVFVAGGRQQTHWFPGHMAKGFRLMQQHLRRCDCVLEVHDARIEGAGRNPKFDILLGKPRVVIMNKCDLAGYSDTNPVPANTDYIYTNCNAQWCPDVVRIVPRVLELVDSKALSREVPFLRLMVIGIPNVGKSSLINSLRRHYTGKGKVARVGNNPGVTRALQTDIKIFDTPPVYLVDTPGVMIPSIEDTKTAMQLALVGTMRDDLVGEEMLADFLLFSLNRHQQFRYVDVFDLDEPSDDASIVLPAVAKRMGSILPGGAPDIEKAARHMLLKYRQGLLGTFKLDL